MATKTKIKIDDHAELRKILDLEYENSSQVRLCQYALLLARHILELVNYPYQNNKVIQNGFLVNEAWQKGKARMHDVRQAGFQIHKLAKESDSLLFQTALRVVGQAIASGHMKEHAMVASDYAIKVINLMYSNNDNAVVKERQWQIDTLKSIEQTKNNSQ